MKRRSRGSRRGFTRTAMRVHPANAWSGMRGGIRL